MSGLGDVALDEHNGEFQIGVTEYPVTIDQLQPGVFIRITGVSWLSHPFLMNSLKITSRDQINVLHKLKIKT
jgi:hypothetical protein